MTCIADGRRFVFETKMDGVLHHEEEPARVVFNERGVACEMCWYIHGEKKKEQIFHEDGEILKTIIYDNNKMLMDVVHSNNYSWFVATYQDGLMDHYFLFNDKGRITKEMYFDQGRTHQSNGPASINYISGKEIWYWKGEECSKETHLGNWDNMNDEARVKLMKKERVYGAFKVMFGKKKEKEVGATSDLCELPNDVQMLIGKFLLF